MTRPLFNRFRLCHMASALLALPLALAGSAWAQPDLENAPKAENPANRAPRAGRRAEGRPGRRGQDETQNRLTRQFRLLGITDPAQQKALSTYIQGESTAHEALVEKGRSLNLSLRAATLTDAQVAGLLNTYNAAIEDAKARRQTALATLQKTVNLAKNPKVEAYLTLLGFYGEGPAVMNAGNFRDRTLRRNFRIPVVPNAAGATATKTHQTAPATPVAPLVETL